MSERTTLTGVQFIDCVLCGRNHPEARTFCEPCGRCSLFGHEFCEVFDGE